MRADVIFVGIVGTRSASDGMEVSTTRGSGWVDAGSADVPVRIERAARTVTEGLDLDKWQAGSLVHPTFSSFRTQARTHLAISVDQLVFQISA